MTDGDSSGGSDDILPTDDAPEEDEGGGFDTDQEPEEESSGDGSEDIFLPDDDAESEADDADESGDADADESEADDDAKSEADDADPEDADAESEAGDDAESGLSPDQGFDPGGSGGPLDDASEELGETETTDNSGEVVIEEEPPGEASTDKAKGLAELDRELEQMGSDTSSTDDDVGAAAGTGAAADRGGPGAGTATSTGGGHTEASNEVDGWGANKGQATQRYCQECGSSISRNAEICPNCGVSQSKDSSGDTDPGVAALLSFLIPGLGDFYSDETELGVIILLAWIAWIGIGWVLIGGGFTILTFGIGLFLVLPVLLAVELLIHVGAAVISYSAAS